MKRTLFSAGILAFSLAVPPGKSVFVHREEGVPSDHYLWLTGMAGKMLRREIPFSKTIPERK